MLGTFETKKNLCKNIFLFFTFYENILKNTIWYDLHVENTFQLIPICLFVRGLRVVRSRRSLVSVTLVRAKWLDSIRGFWPMKLIVRSTADLVTRDLFAVWLDWPLKTAENFPGVVCGQKLGLGRVETNHNNGKFKHTHYNHYVCHFIKLIKIAPLNFCMIVWALWEVIY